MPKGDVPGEWYSPTQPFPTKPPAFERQGVTIDDLIDFTPELRAEAVKLASQLQARADLHAAGGQQWQGPLGTLMLPQRRAARTGRAARSIPRRTCSTSSRTTGAQSFGLINDPAAVGHELHLRHGPGSERGSAGPPAGGRRRRWRRAARRRRRRGSTRAGAPAGEAALRRASRRSI